MSKNYEKYTLEELISDSDFIQWSKYPTDETNLFWQNIAAKNSAISEIIHTAQAIVKSLSIAVKYNAPTSDIPVIWSEIEEDINPQQPLYFKIRWKHWVAAASVLIVLGFGYWLDNDVFLNNDKIYIDLTSDTPKPIKEIINTTQTKLAILMPDGSKVLLEPNSRLSYNPTFEGELREVYLSGEAFFEVKKNPKKPFLVYANSLVTKVLGTSFSVKAYAKDKQVFVKVNTGKVSVYQNKLNSNNDPEISGIVLTPNQQVIFGKSEEKFIKSLVEKPTILLTSQELINFSFKNVPIEQIFLALEKAYGVDIIYDKESMLACRLTTSLTTETLFEKLDIICAGVEATYKVVDAQIIITSNGCH